MSATTADLVKKYVELNEEIKTKDAEIGALKTELATIQEELLARWERSSTTQMRILGQTVYIHRQLWPKNIHESSDTVLALKASGLDDLVEEKHNSNRLAAYVREIAREHEEGGLPLTCEQIREYLPLPLKTAIDVTEKVSLRVRRG